MTLPIVPSLSIPQTRNGVVIDGSSGGGIAPAPFASEVLGSAFVWPAPAGAYALFDDPLGASPLALVSFHVIVPPGCVVQLIQGDFPNVPPTANCVFRAVWDGNIVPGEHFIRPNASTYPFAGPSWYVVITGVDCIGFTATYTGPQQ